MWNEYNTRGKTELALQIELLKQEMDDMRLNFDIISSN